MSLHFPSIKSCLPNNMHSTVCNPYTIYIDVLFLFTKCNTIMHCLVPFVVYHRYTCAWCIALLMLETVCSPPTKSTQQDLCQAKSPINRYSYFVTQLSFPIYGDTQLSFPLYGHIQLSFSFLYGYNNCPFLSMGTYNCPSPPLWAHTIVLSPLWAHTIVFSPL